MTPNIRTPNRLGAFGFFSWADMRTTKSPATLNPEMLRLFLADLRFPRSIPVDPRVHRQRRAEAADRINQLPLVFERFPSLRERFRVLRVWGLGPVILGMGLRGLQSNPPESSTWSVVSQSCHTLGVCSALMVVFTVF